MSVQMKFLNEHAYLDIFIKSHKIFVYSILYVNKKEVV